MYHCFAQIHVESRNASVVCWPWIFGVHGLLLGSWITVGGFAFDATLLATVQIGRVQRRGGARRDGRRDVNGARHGGSEFATTDGAADEKTREF